MLCLFQGRKRRKVRWSNTRTRRKKKGSSDDDDNDSEEESSDEDESEEEDDSDESYKVERSRKRRNRNRERRESDSSTSTDDDLPPNDDPCKHCGLPNHPELVGTHNISGLYQHVFTLFNQQISKQKLQSDLQAEGRRNGEIEETETSRNNYLTHILKSREKPKRTNRF